MKRFFESPEPITSPEDTPLVFLEGPVQGAPHWQADFAHQLLDVFPDIAVASPRALPQHQRRIINPDTHNVALALQNKYEILARRLAFRFGAIALWYAAQDTTIPYKEGRVYAKTSEKEDSEVWGWMVAHPDYPFVVGYEPGFRNLPEGELEYNNRNHHDLGIVEHTSLDDVFKATVEAVEYAKRVGSRSIPSLTSQSIQRVLGQLDSEWHRTYSKNPQE
jgi:hypothetical protein